MDSKALKNIILNIEFPFMIDNQIHFAIPIKVCLLDSNAAFALEYPLKLTIDNAKVTRTYKNGNYLYTVEFYIKIDNWLENPTATAEREVYDVKEYERRAEAYLTAEKEVKRERRVDSEGFEYY